MKKFLCLALALMMCLLMFASCSKQEMKIGKEYRALSAQMDVLLQLNAKSIDVGVMDSIMAGYYMSKDTSYVNSLMIVEGLELSTEQYGIAARKGSGLIKKINAALIELTKAGTVTELAEKYGIASELCIDQSAVVSDLTESELEDWNYIVEQKKFVVGYTLFAPIAYQDDANNGTLIGFDIELARAVAEKLNLNVEFKLIEWDTKEAMLTSRSIDCIWNGLTITEERLENMEISIPYLNNKQVAVIRIADKDKYTTTESMSGAIMGAESGSAGESCIIVVDDAE